MSQTSASIVGVSTTAHGVSVALHVAPGPGEERLRIVGVPLRAFPVARDIIVYDDPSYPVAGSTGGSVFGVFKHLQAELAIRHAESSVVETNAIGLAHLFADVNTAGQHIVVVTTGAFPATVLDSRRNLVGPWLRAGGTLVWGGDAIGYYSAQRGVPLGAGTADPKETGPFLVLGVDALSFPDARPRDGDYPSQAARALGVEYRHTGIGVDLAHASGQGAVALGWQTGTISSIALVPTGQGRALVFGGEVYDEVIVVRDLVRILMSDALESVGPLGSMTVELSALDPHGIVQIEVPMPPGVSIATIAAFDDNPYATYAFHQTVVARRTVPS
jgi:hypothetical protein